MADFLFLFHSTLGVIQTRKALQAEGMTFRIADIPRQLHRQCGLCIYLNCPPGEETRWIIPGHTESLYRYEKNDWCCIGRFDSCGS